MDSQIKASLIALLTGIKNSDGSVISAEMVRLDGFASQGRGSLHPQLLHFLERRSYAKALMFLSGEADIPAGICGGGKTGPAGGAR